jgi:hypothetical protein
MSGMIINNARNWSSFSIFESLIWSFSSFVIIGGWLHVMGSNFYDAHPYKFYFVAATLLAYFFGYITASIFILASSIYANLYFVPPFGVFSLSADHVERFLINLFFGGVAIFFIEILQRQIYNTKLRLLVSESRYLILLHRDNQLLQKLKK